MATVYNVMLYGGLALAIVFAIVAVVLFFVLKIPKAVGDRVRGLPFKEAVCSEKSRNSRPSS